MQPFSDAEIEFFVETNGRLSANRALALGARLVAFVETQFAEGELEAIEIVHLGRGSFRSRLMLILRDPATGTAAAIAALVLSGANILQTEEDNAFAEETAKACIESGAARCGFRTSNDEFFIEREAMPAVAKMQSLKANSDGAFSDSFSPAFAGGQAQAGTAPQFVEGVSSRPARYEPAEIDVVGVFDTEGGIPKIYTIDGSHELALRSDQNRLPEKRVADFRLRGPLEPYGHTYALEGWVVRDAKPIETFVGRMIEVFDGRAIVFETIDGQHYTPVIPDDTLGWVPLGVLVQVKASLSVDDQLEIYDWNEIDRDDTSVSSADAATHEISTLSGMLSEGFNGPEFKADWGGTALVDGIADGLNIPHGQLIEIDAELRRGSRGGMADPRLFIHSWRPAATTRPVNEWTPSGEGHAASESTPEANEKSAEGTTDNSDFEAQLVPRKLPPGSSVKLYGRFADRDGNIKFITEKGREFLVENEGVDSLIMFGAPCVVTATVSMGDRFGDLQTLTLEDITELPDI